MAQSPRPERCPTHGVIHRPGEGHGNFETRVVSQSGRVESKQVVTGKDVSYTLAAGGEEHIKTIHKIKQRVQNMVEGKEDPAKLRADLERYYLKQMTSRSFGGKTPEIKGAKFIKVIYVRSPGEQYALTWQWLPNSIGGAAMVTGLCPECLIRAPSHVDVTERTKPVIVDSRLGWVPGNPEADAKEVTFRLTYPIFHMRIDAEDRLTVREIVRCPTGRHGPHQRLVGERCTWAVRIEDGIASRVSPSLVKETTRRGTQTGQIVAADTTSNATGAQTGQIVIAK